MSEHIKNRNIMMDNILYLINDEDLINYKIPFNSLSLKEKTNFLLFPYDELLMDINTPSSDYDTLFITRMNIIKNVMFFINSTKINM